MGFLFSKPEVTKSPPGPPMGTKTPINDAQRSAPEGTNFKTNILFYSNEARRMNGLNNLTWNDNLAKKAAEWNTYLKNQENCTIRHPTRSLSEKQKYLPGHFGQNLFVSHGFPTDPGNAEMAVQSWYDECLDYVSPPQSGVYPRRGPPQSGVPSNFSKVGHFTQMVWKDTNEIGCARIDCPKNIRDSNGVIRAAEGSIITCNYDKGNVAGLFGSHVPKAKCPFK